MILAGNSTLPRLRRSDRISRCTILLSKRAASLSCANVPNLKSIYRFFLSNKIVFSTYNASGPGFQTCPVTGLTPVRRNYEIPRALARTQPADLLQAKMQKKLEEATVEERTALDEGHSILLDVTASPETLDFDSDEVISEISFNEQTERSPIDWSVANIVSRHANFHCRTKKTSCWQPTFDVVATHDLPDWRHTEANDGKSRKASCRLAGDDEWRSRS